MLLRLLIFALPFAVFPGLPLGLAVAAGEVTPMRTVAERQMQGPLLYGRLYRDDYFAFKLISTRLRSPRILVLGSSRVMQFRAEMFGDAAPQFYNAGGSTSTMREALEFVRQLKAPFPELMVFGIDHSWLPQAAPFEQAKLNVVTSDGTDVARSVRLSHLVLKDWFSGRIPFRQVVGRREPFDRQPAMGVSAIAWGNGFRPDGSYQYGLYRREWPPVEKRLEEGRLRLQTHVVPMNAGDHIDPKVLEQLSDLLAECAQRNIEVLGFSTPFAPTTLGEMQNDPALGYMREAGPALRARFDAAGRHYQDWTDIRPLGMTDADMIDYFHPSERVIARIWQQLETYRTKGSTK